MEHLVNRSLERVMAEDGLLPLSRTVDLIEQIASKLQEARAQGIVLCDLQPGSILLAEEWGKAPQVLGFGKPDERLAARGSGGGSRYMAPEEQVAGTNDADERADQFSLAAIAYEMLTGLSPFSEEDLEAKSEPDKPEARPRRPPAPVGDMVVGLPAGLDDVLRRAMSFEPSERFARVEDFTAALRKISEAPHAEAAAAGTPAPEPFERGGPVTAKVPVRRQAGGVGGWLRSLMGPQERAASSDERVPPPMVAPAAEGLDPIDPATLAAIEAFSPPLRRRSRARFVVGAGALAVAAVVLGVSTYHKGAKVPVAYVRIPSPAAPVAARAAEVPAVPAPAKAPEPPPSAPAPAGPTIAAASPAQAVATKHRRPGRSRLRRSSRHASHRGR